MNCRSKKSNNNNRERVRDLGRKPNIMNPCPTMEKVEDSNENLYYPALLSPTPIGCQIRTALHHRSIAKLCRMSSHLRVNKNNASGSNSGLIYDVKEYPEAWNHNDVNEPMNTAFARPTNYSLSCCQGNVTNPNLA